METRNLKVVTRVSYNGSRLSGFTASRDTRWLTSAGVDRHMQAMINDAIAFEVSGTVHVNGKPYASFGPFGKGAAWRKQHLAEINGERAGVYASARRPPAVS